MLISYLLRRLPFPISLLIFSFLGNPLGSTFVSISKSVEWKNHFKRRYCKKCGDLRDFLFQPHRHDTPPLHLNCRSRKNYKYQPPHSGWYLSRAVPWMFLSFPTTPSYLISTSLVSFLRYRRWDFSSLGGSSSYPLIRLYCKEPMNLYRWHLQQNTVTFHSFTNRKYYQISVNPTISMLPDSLDPFFPSQLFLHELPSSLLPPHFQTFNTTGNGNTGSVRALQVGDTFTITAFTGANPSAGGYLGISFRDSTTYSNFFSSTDNTSEARFQLDNTGGWKVYNGGTAVDSGLGSNSDRTFTIKITSDNTFNATIGGNTYYDLSMAAGGGKIDSFSIKYLS